MDFKHIPVLFNETIENLKCKEGGVYVDCTLGGAGHASEIAKRIGLEGTLIGVDQDIAAIKAAENKLVEAECKVELIRDNYKNIRMILDRLEIENVDGYLFDLGFSSHQIDTPERGFSYQHEAPLDMRMDQRQSITAADLLNKLSKAELTKIITEYGEERWASRIAEFIVEIRKDKPFELTTELIQTIKAAIPASARRHGPHPARRTFQALRIAVNDELDIISETIEDIIPTLKTGGRVAIITFHSLEDRIVKHKFRELARGCVCPPDFPVCACDKEKQVKVITRRPIDATQAEIDTNPRARSAKLRVIEKL
ncbi:16S rRNA (cytosine(1402)-N(4))-methyltransferase RsmH [Selenihalanaerobacter shriftii]|uniref:Ribosomal RNA small subunit methyltransferase H n=1 Tax=Selenihalanaerobacter shriftii TaxID=142842 RepID=A0A1T4JZ40_9FIRM|nr:16S rRNA (cytosine(1402)-N(4))-methyltransferase RsmH [Selenihalanaerobacter shriftii]SJZ35433.1 16S rRNA (cytosine1402-N4)-methyltransferase [Selenihalanaerobacter shriftii]